MYLIGEWQISLFIFLLAIFYPLELKSFFNKHYIPYIFGKKETVKISFFGKNVSGCQFFTYAYDLSNIKKGKLWLHGSAKYSQNNTPKPGNNTSMYLYRHGKKNFAMPDVPYVKEKFALNTMILKD